MPHGLGSDGLIQVRRYQSIVAPASVAPVSAVVLIRSSCVSHSLILIFFPICLLVLVHHYRQARVMRHIPRPIKNDPGLCNSTQNETAIQCVKDIRKRLQSQVLVPPKNLRDISLGAIQTLCQLRACDATVFHDRGGKFNSVHKHALLFENPPILGIFHILLKNRSCRHIHLRLLRPEVNLPSYSTLIVLARSTSCLGAAPSRFFVNPCVMTT